MYDRVIQLNNLWSLSNIGMASEGSTFWASILDFVVNADLAKLKTLLWCL